MGIPRPKIKNTGSAPKISIGYLTLITPKQLGLSCPCWKFSTKNFQANNLKSAVKILMYYRTNCRVFIITVFMTNTTVVRWVVLTLTLRYDITDLFGSLCAFLNEQKYDLNSPNCYQNAHGSFCSYKNKYLFWVKFYQGIRNQIILAFWTKLWNLGHSEWRNNASQDMHSCQI